MIGAMAILTASAQDRVRIQTNIKGLSKSDTLCIKWGATNKTSTPYIMQRGAIGDSAFIVDVDEPRLLVLCLKGSDASYELLISPGDDVMVTGRIKKYITSLKTEYWFKKMKVNGAGYQQLYTNTINNYRRHQDSIDNKVFSEYRDVVKLMKKSKLANDEQAIADMYQTLHGQSYIDRVMTTYNEKELYAKSTIIANKDTFLGPLLMLKIYGSLDKSMKPLYDAMSDAARNNTYGREVKEEVDPPTFAGHKASPLAARDSMDRERKVDLAQTGNKYTLLVFWASWCQPCHKEIPNLKRIYAKYHDFGLGIIGVSVDQSKEEWIESLRELEEPWQNYIDVDRNATTSYSVKYIPSIFVIDANGNIINEKLRGKELSDYVDKIFAM